MPDIFDEFMDELKRRSAAGPGGPRRPGGTGGPRRVGPEDEGPGDGDGPGGPDEPGGDEPEPIRPRRSPPRRSVRSASGGPGLRVWLAIVVVLAAILLLTGGVDFWTDVLWYRSVGFDSVFWTRVGATSALFLGGLVVSLAVLLGNLRLAGRLAPPAAGGGAFRTFLGRLGEAAQAAGQGPYGGPGRSYRVVGESTAPGVEMPDLTPLASWGLAALAVLIAIAIGAALAGSWETILLWINRVPFSPDPAKPVVDPIFGHDISWFLFELPFLRLVQATFNGLVIAAIAVAGIRYLVAASRGSNVNTTPIRAHIGILAGLFLLSTAFGYQLDKYELAYSSAGVAAGVSYTDANARFFAYDLLTVLSGLAAAFMVGGAFTRWVWPLGATLVAWLVASFVVGTLYPAAVQRFSVDPNKFAQEQPYIANNIAMTRLAFGIDKWQELPFSGADALTQQAVDQDQATFQNARLWDYRPLGNTLDQLQTLKTYYTFTNVDTDRYQINGSETQVMLSARELISAGTTNTSSWVNQRIIYTHGVGAVMVPVSGVTPEGQPQLLIQNLPPVSLNGAPTISEPRIYFGEATDSYVVVGARQDEFDYPRGTGDTTAGGTTDAVATRWTGTTGIKLDTLLPRLLYAIRFGDLNLLISDQVTASSQLLMNRSLSQRLQLIAPFLSYDKDPYVVIDSQGRLKFIQDAYTVSDQFPHAESITPPNDSGLGGETINYVRNSVKVVMDAYDGSMTFYVADPSDPIIRAYEGVFHGLFHPLSEMPPDLQAHLRVPEDLFNVQTAIYGRYHVTEPQTFFDGSDVWTVPTGSQSTQSLPSEAYYVEMRLPDATSPEFLLLQPMVPTQRPNMIAWVAARNDSPNYGTSRVYRFPSDSTIFGPAQIEARIDQDPTISAQVTLWNQSGSSVIRGNLIVVPIGNSLIYLQPVYLQSTSSKFPEFQRIVVASPTTVVWGRTLSEALGLLLSGGGAGPTPTPTPSPGTSPSPSATPAPSGSPGTGLPSDVAALIAYANQHFELAQEALRNGDFARYGNEIELVRQALQRLDALAGPSPAGSSGPPASPAPTASKAP